LENQFVLTAVLHKVGTVRYSPSGVPILDVVLQHSSRQQENGIWHQVKFELPAKIIGQNAQAWQQKVGETVTVRGFLTQKSMRQFSPMLHIQHITEYKG